MEPKILVKLNAKEKKAFQKALELCFIMQSETHCAGYRLLTESTLLLYGVKSKMPEDSVSFPYILSLEQVSDFFYGWILVTDQAKPEARVFDGSYSKGFQISSDDDAAACINIVSIFYPK